MRLLKSLALTALLALSASANAAVILNVDVSDVNPSINDTITVDLLATTTTPADAIGGFTLSLIFDSSLLQLASPVTVGNTFIPAGIPSAALFSGTSMAFGGQAGVDILLARFEFLVVGAGSSAVQATGSLVNGFFQPIFDIDFGATTLSVSGADPVSAPTALLMLAGALAWVGRRKMA